MKRLINRRVAIIIASNLIPLFSVLLFGGDIRFLLLIFWAESGVVGVFNIIMMATTRSKTPGDNFMKIFMIPFFTVHYGGFMFVHLIFLLFFMDNFGYQESVITYLSSNMQLILLNLLALFLGYLYDFNNEWLLNEKRETVNLSNLMFQPYNRIIIMQLTIIFGAFLYFELGSSWVFLILLI
ncbi:MAG: DUF6498-containing protein, partial [Candidatus Bathyarchaeota archaeon]|nr:DUF6498-containing protein [Candidatus Bathyarchaeota archaeon]